jgi:hypothetical protein
MDVGNILGKVLSEIQTGDFHKALVRLWVISAARPSGDTVLNHWERHLKSKLHDKCFHQFKRDFSDGKQISAMLVISSPLAFIQALDAFLFEEIAPRRISNVPYEIDGSEYWLVQIPLGRRSVVPLAKQPNNRAHWFKHHNVIPCSLGPSNGVIKVQVKEPDRATHERLVKLRNEPILRAYLVHFIDKVELLQKLNPAEKLFCCRIENSEYSNEPDTGASRSGRSSQC